MAGAPHETRRSFAVVPIAAKGMGCVALRRIETGERILLEPPLLELGAKRSPLAAAVQALSTAERVAMFALSQNEARFGAEKTAWGIYATNAIPYMRGRAAYSALFATASRFNRTSSDGTSSRALPCCLSPPTLRHAV